MRIYECVCNTPLFFDNSQCLSCSREVGWCPNCYALRALEALGNGVYCCTHPDCAAELVKCQNYQQYDVCNRMVARSEYERGFHFCDCCRCNSIIPDLSIPGAQARWSALERAKRRLFYTLDLLGLPHQSASDPCPELPLSFSFMGDAVPEGQGRWRWAGQDVVYTGHAQGNITINVREADDAERERMRVNMGEEHRTLIGHFRHEIGHYYWELLVKNRDEEACMSVFGDHRSPTYAQAMDTYYANGPAPDWRTHHVSAYASMHPWEDFAETFALYLDIVSVMDTAEGCGLCKPMKDNTLEATLGHWARLGIMLNELNRDMGLLDFAPEIIQSKVIEKLRYIDRLITQGVSVSRGTGQ
ncbi:zinc-binding metallopeptidase family protein [Carnimonas nigrificans]|uniref:zinc-binding metallopeptidase family protein n=1 Tax=Carnimonas nigrificans TaxID=64323 RepID=UPI0004723729|nr:putative zinc-binding metallopeptidase [Carnimonas nigrificans]